MKILRAICVSLVLMVASCGPSTGDGPRPFRDGGDQDSAVTCIKGCDEVGANCGQISDRCGGLLNCGACTAPATCGGGGVSGICGQPCTARTCASQNISCGPAGDGCGGLLNCGDCTPPAGCGGSGQHNICGGTVGCSAFTCASQNMFCGPAGDGCGGLLNCSACMNGETCGGGGTPGVCGKPTVTNPCTPVTCGAAGIHCGPMSDGCGGVLQCGGCAAPKTCGGGGVPSVCGGTAQCVPKTCTQQNLPQGLHCGPAGDGCGGALQCGDCTAPQTCGGGGTNGVCGGSTACIPRTCAQQNFTCGAAGDGCGNLIQCGTCIWPDICGGGGQPGKRGRPPADRRGACLRRVVCGGGVTTTISGTVHNPAGTDPLYNAVVYIPNAAVQPFTTGVSCDKCGADVSGSPLVVATTTSDGKFTLSDVPVGANIPLVIQMGRWRRQVTLANVNSCTDNPVSDALTRLPRNKSEGDIPLFAMVTGAVDALECVLRKMGIDDSEFTGPSGNGRVRLYYANSSDCTTNSPTCYGWGACVSGDCVASNHLTSSSAELGKYDVVILGCEGMPFTKLLADRANMIDYVNKGGRLFATHFSYTWLYYSTSPFSGTAAWQPNQTWPTNPLTGIIDTSFPKGQAFAQWLPIVGVPPVVPGTHTLPISTPRHDVNSTTPPSQRWIYSNYSSTPWVPATVQHYTFNTPVGTAAADQCGRVLFSDFHVTNAYTYYNEWPDECTTSAMTAQEKVLEFMIFDLSSCVTPDTPTPLPTCTPKTCVQLGFSCGMAGDGCGSALNCGPCTLPDTCGGSGVVGVCGHTSCTPKTCQQQNLHCGPAGDGCGHQLDCGPCPAGQTCGGSGTPGQCGAPTCTLITCAQLGANGCGSAGDGCGGQISCSCISPDTCGGGGSPGKCGHTVTCVPFSCAHWGFECGPAGDGCGNVLDCGLCTPPDSCGGGGVPGVCGRSNCVPETCQDQGIECGPAGDGCGNLLNCGVCKTPDTCGGGGKPGFCGSVKPPA